MREERSADRPTRAALLWHGKSLWCGQCFASQIAAAEAETVRGARTRLPFSPLISKHKIPNCVVFATL